MPESEFFKGSEAIPEFSAERLDRSFLEQPTFLFNERNSQFELKPEFEAAVGKAKNLIFLWVFEHNKSGTPVEKQTDPLKKAEYEMLAGVADKVLIQSNRYNTLLEEMSDEELICMSDMLTSAQLMFSQKFRNDKEEVRTHWSRQLAELVDILRSSISPLTNSPELDLGLFSRIQTVAKDVRHIERERSLDYYANPRKVLKYLFSFPKEQDEEHILALPKSILTSLQGLLLEIGEKNFWSQKKLFDYFGVDASSFGLEEDKLFDVQPLNEDEEKSISFELTERLADLQMFLYRSLEETQD